LDVDLDVDYTLEEEKTVQSIGQHLSNI